MTFLDILEIVFVFLLLELFCSGLIVPILIGIGVFIVYRILRRMWRKHIK